MRSRSVAGSCHDPRTVPTDHRLEPVSASDAIAHVKSGMRVFVHGAAATPTPLLDALCERTDVEGVTLYHLHTSGAARLADPCHEGRLRSVSLFTGAELRGAVAEGRADFMPVFLSEIPALFRRRRIPLDVALVQLSPPDRRGLCTLGTSIDTARAAVDSARIVIAEINERMPRTHGNSVIPLSRVTAYVRTDRPLPSAPPSTPSEIENRIADFVTPLVPDGATLQMGIGAIPDAVLARLHDKHDLGVHTEMFTDGLIPLLESGVVNNRRKHVHPDRTVTSFVSGSQKLYDYVHDNPLIEFHGCDRTNDAVLIRKNPRIVAINSAIEIDLTGQVCADSVGHRIVSGIGGQMDFMHAASSSEDGVPIIALPSMARRAGSSRIVPALRPGAGVVTTRGHVHWVVTEWGAVDLHGMTLRERAQALISIAHPDARAELRRAALETRHFVLDP